MGLMKRVLSESPEDSKRNVARSAESVVRLRSEVRIPPEIQEPGEGHAVEGTGDVKNGQIQGQLPDDFDDAADPLYPDQATKAILQEILNLPATIEGPSHLFSILSRSLQIRKGALLLPDPDERLFVPWTITGFDTTTQRRLRIPEDDLRELFADRSYGIVFFVGEDRRKVKGFFSNREFTVLDTVVLARFLHDGQSLGILILADTPFFGLDPTILRVVWSAFEASASELLYRCREERISRIMSPLLFTQDKIVPMANEALSTEGAAEVGLTFVVVDPAESVDTIASVTLGTDRYRIQQDFLRVLNSLLAGLGSVFVTDENHMVLMHAVRAEDDAQFDNELLMHQVTNKMRAVFGCDAFPEQIRCRIVRFPAESSDIEELAGSL